MNIKDFIKPNVLQLKPYNSARSEYSGKSGIFLDANENPYGKFNRYPDPYQKTIKNKISALKNIPVEQIFLGNGSDEVLDVVMRVFLQPNQDSILIFPPTYGMYEVLANINQIQIHHIHLNRDFQLDIPKIENFLKKNQPKMSILCSPNNPTGNCLKNITDFLEIFKGIVVIDEAYIDFAEEPSFLHQLSDYPQVIVSQTFSKAWGLASIRVGMAFAHPTIIQYMNFVKYPYNISQINQKILLSKLLKINDYHNQIKKILVNREFLINQLKSIKIIKKIFPTDANFVLVQVEDANLIYQKLQENELPIIVRNRHSQIPNTLRITVGKKSEIKNLIKKLREIEKFYEEKNIIS